ncbi:MAG: KGK domain-containing protein [Xenococcus sp. MO_188.B8]|nr:KGK domain-containing protein [Xenococcus sp. MO_188.B8]
MENIDRLINNDEVISINNKEDNVLLGHHTYKANEFLHRLGEHIDRHKIDRWIVDGVPCQLLSPNQNWQSGKIKICVQFIPDRPESVLDDIRKNIEDC